MEQSFESYTLRDILRIFYLNKIFFVIFPILLVVPAYIGYEMITTTYTASVKMYVKAENKTEADFYVNRKSSDIIGDHAQLVTSNIVISRVVEVLKLYEIPANYEEQYATPFKKFLINRNREKKMRESLQDDTVLKRSNNGIGSEGAKGWLISKMNLVPAGGSNFFYINVTDFNPNLAVKIANSLSRSYVIFDLEQQIEELKLKYGEKYSTVIQLENYISEYKKYLNGELMPDIEAIGPATVKIIVQAEGASMKKKVAKPLLMSFAVFTGIFLSIVFTAIIEYYNNSFRTPKDVVKYLNVPFIGSIPKRKKNDELIMSDEHLAKSSLKCVSSFQRLGDKLCLLSKRENVKTILLTAFNEFSDTSALIANLGIYLSRDAGKRVLIIDANLKNPSLAKAFNMSNNSGLPDIFERKKTFQEAVGKINKNLDILLSHEITYRPIALLDSTFMPALIREVRDNYDFVFVDCSADLKRDTEPVILSSFTDATILVINEGIDRFQDAQIVMKNLNQNGNRMIFSVLNNRKEDMPNLLYKIS